MSKKSKRERQERQSRKTMIIIVAAVLAVLTVSAIGLFVFLKQVNGDEPLEPSAEIKAASEAAVKLEDNDGKLRAEAKEQIDKNDTQKADQVYQAAIASETEVNRKIQLYVDLANVYYDAGKQDEAIATAQRAFKLSSDKYLAADWLARAYEDRKEYASALEYLKIARDSTKSSQNVAILDVAYYDSEIARVTKLSQGVKS